MPANEINKKIFIRAIACLWLFYVFIIRTSIKPQKIMSVHICKMHKLQNVLIKNQTYKSLIITLN